MSKINRRDFLKIGVTTGSFLALSGSSNMVTRVFGKTETAQKIIILGFDGMDPRLVKAWMDEGKLPAFRKLQSQGTFTPLRTSTPPQSPVAWSNFTTGMNAGGHGIYDFTHRDPKNYIPIFSATESSPSGKILSLGNYKFPLSGGKVTNLRKGKAFWQILEEHDIPATIFKIPSNYPPVPTKQRTISGMNTPDMLGSYGIFNYYTTVPSKIDQDIGGGRIHEVYVIGNRIESKISGPVNTFRKDDPETSIDFKVFVDPVNPVAKIAIQDQEFILKEGEWSSWKKLNFNLIPTQSVSGICKFFLKQIRPEFKLYVSPINIDPGDPALPISTPENYAKELEEKFGSFYTQGLPGDFKALNNEILDDGEFLDQDDMVLEERLKMFDYELARFNSGVLFYYLSSTDQRQHMFWRYIDKDNSFYDPSLATEYKDTIQDIYIEADKMLDKALKKADKNTIIMVVSDHGFSPFRRAFNANTWLLENGYHSLINKRRQGESNLFLNTDWSRSKSYAYGLNGLYINEKGRELEGIVGTGAEKENLIREIAKKLENYIDPKTGERAIYRAYIAKDIYSGLCVDQAPDIILGFNKGYRISWSSPLGRIPKEIVEDNPAKWSGDHCVAPDIVPGIFFMNRKINTQFPALYDMAPTILKIFGIDPPQNMTGRPII